MMTFLTWARYNQAMNNRLYKACVRLQPGQFTEDRGAFFGSVCRTLNHILIADTYWLSRFADDKSVSVLLDGLGKPIKITALDQIVYEDLAGLTAWRKRIDKQIIRCMQAMEANDADLSVPMTHRLVDGTTLEFTLNKALCHWFNHQTHHRGQVTTLLTQMGVDVGDTDLLLMDLG
ncbi:MAG: damage-inducible protein DinB [Pseudomonadales bacterium]|nr:damage-inducible protein DinB [Pseudomonadales bacterium]